ncbi:MAG: tetratricopeptide repeat protein [Sandaracinaceae bacterium]
MVASAVLLAACGGPMRDGRLAMVRGDFEGAARAYGRATEAQPDDPQTWLALGRAEMAAERYPRARDAFERVARLRPRAALPRVLIGNTWELSRRYDEALLAYRHATQVAPRSAYAHRVMGTRLLRWGRTELARPVLERAVELDRTHAETWNALALARYHDEDLDGAEQAFREGIALHPRHRGLKLGLAALLINRGQHQAALALYDEVLASRPRFAPAHVGRGILLHELDRQDEAEAAFVEAVRVARDPAEYRERLRAYRALRAGQD